MVPLLSAVIVAAAILLGATRILREMRARREAAAQQRALAIMQMFAPALERVQDDPRVLLVWQPIARAIRQLYPIESAAVDRALGSAFPFGRELMAAAHARWTSAWLSWERAHDAEYKLKALMLQQELAGAVDSEVGRARADALEREKLAEYQRRYEEYARVGKTLQAFATTSAASASSTASSTANALQPAISSDPPS